MARLTIRLTSGFYAGSNALSEELLFDFARARFNFVNEGRLETEIREAGYEFGLRTTVVATGTFLPPTSGAGPTGTITALTLERAASPGDTGRQPWIALSEITLRVDDLTRMLLDGEDPFVSLLSGNDTIIVEAGSTTGSYIYAGGGNDVVRGGAGADRLYGEGGNDELHGNAGNDVLHGGVGHDRLFGGLGNDVLVGGPGNDLLVGGRNVAPGSVGWVQETLVGGRGADRFVFQTVADSPAGNPDLILDFRRADGDRIDLRAIDGNQSLTGKQALTFIGTSPFSAPGQVRYAIDDAAGLTRVFVNTLGTGGAEMEIELRGLIALQASDFLFV